MSKVVTIYEAKTQFSKLVKKAASGEIIYVGAYGQAQAIIAPVPTKLPLQIGVWANKKKTNAYNNDDLVKPDPEITDEMHANIDVPLPWCLLIHMY